MDELNTNAETTQITSDEQVQQTIFDTISKIRTQALLLGAQAICSVVIQKIDDLKHKNGKITLNNYKRLVKDIEHFCQTGLSRKVELDGTTSEIEAEPEA